jgi:hypothetical protein
MYEKLSESFSFFVLRQNQSNFRGHQQAKNNLQNRKSHKKMREIIIVLLHELSLNQYFLNLLIMKPKTKLVSVFDHLQEKKAKLSKRRKS